MFADALIEGKTDRVLLDLVSLEATSLGRLNDDAVGAQTAVVDEVISAHGQLFREHDRGAGGVFGKCVVLENIAIGIHVMQPVARVMDDVSLDARVVRKGKIDAVARLADFVAANQIIFAIPLVNSIATAGSDE